MKKALETPPTLGIPDPTKSFVQAVDEREGCMNSVLLQEHCSNLRPVGYYSTKRDPVAAGLPKCLRATAAAEKALSASHDIVEYASLTLLVPHAISLILAEQKTSHLSAARYLCYYTCLLNMPNVTVKCCNTLKPASLVPLPTDGEPHDYVAELDIICSPRPDLTENPLPNADFVLYTDGSAFRDDGGTNRVGYAVNDSAVLCSASLPCHLSAQGAELIALTEACKLVVRRSVTMYIDSRYAFGVVHDFGTLWKCRQFLKSDGKPVLNHALIADLLEAILLPAAIAVCKCSAHTNRQDAVSQGNARADAAAKAAALLPPTTISVLVAVPASNDHAFFTDMQSFVTPQEKALWHSSDVRRQVSAALPVAATGPLHHLQPADYVLVKDHRRKSWKANRWQGPFQVLLVTQTAVKVAE